MSELISALVILWLGFWLLDLLLNGRFWLWELVSMIPSWCILLVLCLLTIATLVSGNQVGLFLLLVFSWLPLRAVDMYFPRPPVPKFSGEGINIISWNTLFWHYYATNQEFAAVLQSHPAHIYHLQEAMDYYGRPTDVCQELAAILPGFTIVQHGEMASATRLPVRQVHKISKNILRLDLEVQGKLISAYNVHLPVQIELRFTRSPLMFFSWVRRAFKLRQEQFALLQQDLAQNPLPCIVTGDFNTPKTLIGIRRLSRSMTDAYATAGGRHMYPVTYTLKGLGWWRIDYILGRKIQFGHFNCQSMVKISDHHLLQAQFRVLDPKT